MNKFDEINFKIGDISKEYNNEAIARTPDLSMIIEKDITLSDILSNMIKYRESTNG